MIEIALKSLISAVFTAVILWVSDVVGPKLAGAIGGLPIVFAVSYVLITMEDKARASDFLVGGVYGAVAAIFFSFVVIALNKTMPDLHWINFVVGYVLCFGFAYGMVHFTGA